MDLVWQSPAVIILFALFLAILFQNWRLATILQELERIEHNTRPPNYEPMKPK